ncbi:hypothetical protein H4R21_002490 [Coemansia helicoidea]|uniref:Uncharacterized protein n=1 Tax=Coemansia helicoidea TaxID=1286919 RepID=A0ACC1L7Q4_9FUNG|nr:hypothetical protein H4R21_002490 [Coemansia helicoidea]
MYPIVTSALSYQPLLSGRRLSAASTLSPSPDSAPLSPVEAPLRRAERMGAVEYTYNCDKCGFGTNLLCSFMPHTSNPCDQPAVISWGGL